MAAQIALDFPGRCARVAVNFGGMALLGGCEEGPWASGSAQPTDATSCSIASAASSHLPRTIPRRLSVRRWAQRNGAMINMSVSNTEA